MDRKEFISTVTDVVTSYINYYDGPSDDAQVKVIPDPMVVELVDTVDRDDSLADNDEAVEDAAAAERSEEKEEDDAQAVRNPDFYAADTLITIGPDGRTVPDQKAIAAVADNYFPA